MAIKVRRGLRAASVISGGALLGALALGQEYVPQQDERFPRIRYADSQLSLNDRCPVRLGKLNTKMAPVYVNGRPVGFC